MFQLLLFYYIVPYFQNVRLFHYILGDNKIYDYEGPSTGIPNDLYHYWVYELAVDNDGYLLAAIGTESLYKDCPENNE